MLTTLILVLVSSEACLTEIFDECMVIGETELSPMSCTADLAIALNYSQGPAGTINTLLWIRTENLMDRGVDLQWISAFRHEQEF
jgi:hypothetical protein